MRILITLLAGLAGLVNPFVGTDFHGHTFPGAAYPFGMVQLSPDTRPKAGDWDGCSGYHYSDNVIYGFSHTHLSGTGCDDLCDILLMPGGRPSTFSHKRESASPGYYEVYLEDPGVEVRLTVGRRIGMHEYRFPSGVSPKVLIDLKHRDPLLESSIRVDGNVVSGHRRSRSWSASQDVYFYMEFSRKVVSAEGDDVSRMLAFDGGRRLTVRVGISSVSVENARENLMAEYPRSFAAQKRKAAAQWESYLSKLDCPASAEPAVFYTALYHTAIHPSLYSDANGEYRGMDRQVHRADGWDRYTIFSLWDTFRGLNPLLAEIEPARTLDFMKSFLSIYDEGGKLPVWELQGYETNCMIGYNSAPVVADALARGISDFDVEKMLEALLVTSRKAEFGLDSFRANGLVLADDEHESVSKTLEYAYDDWCVAQVAKWLMENPSRGSGKFDLEEIYNEYMTSAQYWRNVFDPAVGFMRPRLNGRWLTPFNPREVNNHFTEANSWQYSFFVPQDIAGLIDAQGGREAFEAKLDALFTAPEQTTGRTQADITGLIGQYAHGNEPSHHIAYLYNYVGKPEKAQARVRQILTELYSAEPDGLCGNEDCGQMSAWYVLSALGRYPVCPGLGSDSFTAIPRTIVVNPAFEMEADIFADSLEVSVVNIQKGATAYYRVGGGNFMAYSGPFTVNSACTMEVYSQMPDGRKSFVTRSTVHKIHSDMTIDIHSRYNPQYNAGGDEGLIDGSRGALNWRTGGWQGYQAQDFEAVVDLLSVRDISVVGAGFCQDARSWIWMPTEVEFFGSEDGVSFRSLGTMKTGVDPQDYEVQIKDLECPVGMPVRYVKVVARNFGTIPEWHPGAGSPAFIFIDEIWVR